MKIYVALPVENNGTFLCHLNKWLVELPGRLGGSKGMFLDHVYGSPVAHVRNYIVHRFLRSDSDVLWMIDSDMDPRLGGRDGDHGGVPYILEDLAREDVDIVSGISFRMSERGPVPCVTSTQGREDVIHNLFAAESGPIRLKGLSPGGACLAVKRHVLEGFLDKRKVWFEDMLEHDDPSRFGLLRRSEDIHFFREAEELGYRAWVDTRIVWGHVKPLDLRDELRRTSDLLAAMARQEPARKPKRGKVVVAR